MRQSRNTNRWARVKIPRFDPYALAKLATFAALACLLCFVVLPGILGTWQAAHTMNTLVVTPAMRTQITTTLADKVSRHYLSAAKGKQFADFVRAAERDGRYRHIVSPPQLVDALTMDLRTVTGDMHTRLEFSASEIAEVGDRGIDLPPDDKVSPPEWLLNRVGRSMANFGVDRVSVSDSGIGYIRLTRFFRPFLAEEKYAAAMQKVSGSRALIIDLREARGGHAASVALLASYFFDRPTHLSDIVAPRRNDRTPIWTSAPQGPSYGSQRPLIILTGRDTFSGAEDFAYTMQTRRRATVIGEVTRGGAHPTERFRLSAHFIVHIPVAESVSPLTGTNWEGTGVQPDTVASASAAQRVATRILERPVERQTAADLTNR